MKLALFYRLTIKGDASINLLKAARQRLRPTLRPAIGKRTSSGVTAMIQLIIINV